MPLAAAARNAYEQLEGTIWATAAERMHDIPSPTNTLDYMGQLLINEMEVFGTKPPSTVFRQIDEMRLKRGAVKDDCKTLKSSDNMEPDWTSLAVKRAAFKRRVKQLKGQVLSPHMNKKLDFTPDITSAVPSAAHPIAAVRLLSQGQRATPSDFRSTPPEFEGSNSFDVLKQMASADGGDLIIVETLGGTDFQVGSHNINDSQNARELARLREAVDELTSRGLIKLVNKGDGFAMFNVTATGYKEVDKPAKS